MKSRRDFFQIINSFPHSQAIYLTFTLDNAVINKLAENSYANIIIIHDYRQGVSLRNNWNNRVVCIPVDTPGQHQRNCFHPKLALLKGDDNAKLLLGSANLSKDAFSKEKEICLETDLDFNSELYNDVLDFISGLIPQTHTSTAVLESAVQKFRFSNQPKKVTPGLRLLFTTPNASIFEQFRSDFKATGQPIVRIASPFLSEDLDSYFENLLSALNPKEVHVYLRKGYRLPKTFRKLTRLLLYEPKTRSNRNGFHAKIILIEYPRTDIAFIGSSNFTRQGFFMNLTQGANQECGIAISSRTKSALRDWFKEGWEKPVNATEWEEDVDSATQSAELFPTTPYAWAELSEEKILTIFFYIPDKELVGHVYADGRRLSLDQPDPNVFIYRSTYPYAGESITLRIGSFPEQVIPIFKEHQFEERAKEIGDSLFFETNKIESINPSAVREAVQREGITVKTLGAVVIEPPFLEQYFYNVKNRIAILSKRHFFSDYHILELQSVLKTLDGGEGVYFLLHLMKFFEAKKEKQLFQICRQRAKHLLTEKPFTQSKMTSFETFYREWKKH